MAKILKQNLLPVVLIFLFSIGFITLYSTSTSPLYPYCYGSDSAQFQTMGFAWANGKIPYRDMFDHKGPMAFFFDMLSFKFTGSNIGLYYIQIVLMTIDLFFAFKISKLFSDSNVVGTINVFITMVFFAFVFAQGNLGEEYCIPICFAATYFQIKYFRQKPAKHNVIAGGLYGLAFGVCLFSKLTNAIPICCGALIIIITLIKKKEIKNLLINIASAFIGMLIIALPFSIYFAINGCFKEMIYAMLFFNNGYMEVLQSWAKSADGDTWYRFFLYYFPFYCPIITAILNIYKKNWHFAFCNLLMVLLEGYVLFNTDMGWQYMFMLIPNIVILMSETFELESIKKNDRYIQCFVMALIVGMLFEMMPMLIRSPSNEYAQYKEETAEDYDVLMVNMTEEDLQSFVAYNCPKTIYLRYGILPYYKYFNLQSWHACFSEKVYKEIQSIYQNGDCTWILIGNDSSLIQETLDTRYFLVAEYEGYSLYHIN